MLDARFSHLYFYQSLNRLQRGLSAIAELLVLHILTKLGSKLTFYCLTVRLCKNVMHKFARIAEKSTKVAGVIFVLTV